MNRIARHLAESFDLVEHILRSRLDYFAQLDRDRRMRSVISKLLTITAAGYSVAGFVTGFSGRDVGQALASSAKLPCLFLISGLICLPTLYTFSILFGSRLRFQQTIALILTAQAVSATLVLGFAPISSLFLVSGTDALFLVALNMAVLGLSAVLGLIFLVQGVLLAQVTDPPTEVSALTWLAMLIKGGARSLVLTGWLIIYGLVGAQLSWVLRPLFGVPLQGDNFWSSLGHLARALLQ